MYIHCKDGNGRRPLVLTIPHDGGTQIPGRGIRAQTQRWFDQGGSDPRDEGTQHIADTCLATLLSADGIVPATISVSLHRSHLDVNRAPDKEPFAEGFGTYYGQFHRALDNVIAHAIARHGHCLYIDLHGFMNPPGPKMYDIVLGTDSHRTCPGGLDLELAEQLRQSSFVGWPNEDNYSVVFSPDAKLGVTRRYRGGWNVRSHAEKWGDRLQAIQIELAPSIRARSHSREFFAKQLAETLIYLFATSLVAK